ncbi:MAG: type II toxin-antitoxin system Phd/YefM family antitoxin [Candidatus Competibacteraceae bacterium]|nr:type II toxin-antitoxin system Phd/YefM family antitoxin [Candidatus Competibacteraceae bacterium]
MQTINIHEAKTHLSRLVERAASGEPFVIAKAGKPLVKVMALEAPAPGTKQWFGLLEGQYQIPDDFDTLFQEEIEAAFYGHDADAPT